MSRVSIDQTVSAPSAAPIESSLDDLTLRAYALCNSEVAGVLRALAALTTEQRQKVAKDLIGLGARDDAVADVMRMRVEIVRWLARKAT